MTETRYTMIVERDVFCSDCGAKIDREGRAPDHKDSGMLNALMADDAKTAHRTEGKCPAAGVTYGEWSEPRALETPAVARPAPEGLAGFGWWRATLKSDPATVFFLYGTDNPSLPESGWGDFEGRPWSDYEVVPATEAESQQAREKLFGPILVAKSDAEGSACPLCGGTEDHEDDRHAWRRM